MTDRTLFYTQETLRSFDQLSMVKDAMLGTAWLSQDNQGSALSVVSGFTATPDSPIAMGVNLASGRIYAQAATDTTAFGTLSADVTLIKQQGYASAQRLLLTTAGLSVGQSQWALIQVQFSQSDAVRSGDPTGGILNFWDVTDPTQPLVGLGGNNLPLNTVRQGVAQVSVIYGSAAATGSEVPPNPSAGCVPLYLVDLAFDQSTVSALQILAAAPSVGTGVPSNYPNMPLLAGLLNKHHGGVLGQAPKIDLASEVTGLLPNGNFAPSGHGQVRLSVNSTTQLILKPYNGNAIKIAGVSYAVPSAGITIANTGLVASTLYRAYAFVSSGVVALELSATTHVTDTTAGNVGVEIKSGDTSRTLVGLVWTGAGTPGTFVVPTGLNQLCINWFNRRTLALAGTGTVATTTSTTVVAVGASSTCSFLSWTDEDVYLTVSGTVSNTTGADSVGIQVVLDAAGVGTSPSGVTTAGASTFPACAVFSGNVTEAVHTAQTGAFAPLGGTASVNIAIMGVIRG